MLGKRDPSLIVEKLLKKGSHSLCFVIVVPVCVLAKI